jgi:hypothetical protein
MLRDGVVRLQLQRSIGLPFSNFAFWQFDYVRHLCRFKLIPLKLQSAHIAFKCERICAWLCVNKFIFAFIFVGI